MASIVVEADHVLTIDWILVENRYEHRGLLVWFQTAQEPYCSSLDCWGLQNDIDLLWCTFLVGLVFDILCCMLVCGHAFSSNYTVIDDHSASVLKNTL